MVTARPAPRRLSPFARLRRDASGVSAIEFALVLPLMIALLLSGIEITEAMTIKRKVTHITSVIGDLVTQSKTISNADMDNILDAAEAVISPYASDGLEIIVAGVTVNSSGTARVTWSDARNATAWTVGSTVTLPSGLSQANTFVATAQVTYRYTPAFGNLFTGTLALEDEFFLRPRLVSAITRTN